MTLSSLVQHYAGFFQNFGIGPSALETHYEEWKAQSGNDGVNHYLWYLFHVLIGETKKQVSQAVDQHRNLHDIYVKMLEFRVGVEGQRDNALVRLIIQNRVRQWQYEWTEPFALQAVSLNCCAHCQAINGQVFSVEQVLHHTHFATEQCTAAGVCSCGYVPVKAG